MIHDSKDPNEGHRGKIVFQKPPSNRVFSQFGFISSVFVLCSEPDKAQENFRAGLNLFLCPYLGKSEKVSGGDGALVTWILPYSSGNVHEIQSEKLKVRQMVDISPFAFHGFRARNWDETYST